ncbi:hypothetical protein [Thiomicrospira sp.]|uniref:hypothetical protein n=1 Tax=Thiomicrospira sp. TaxID=935 RepID=UPI002F94ED98
MVTKRKPKSIEEFVDAADKQPVKTVNNASSQADSVRHMGASFSEEEYNLLKMAAKQTSRSMKGYIRYAVTKAAKEDLNQ